MIQKKASGTLAITKVKKCRFSDITKARTAYRMQKESSDGKKHPDRQYRIFCTLTNGEVE